LEREEVYLPEGPAIQSISKKPQPSDADVIELSLEERLKAGEKLYKQNCLACHMDHGKGIPGTFPPLVNSDFLKARADKGIGIVLEGLQGEITVNGQKYNNIMPAVSLSDDQVASILTYIHNEFDNGGGLVKAADVKDWREQK